MSSDLLMLGIDRKDFPLESAGEDVAENIAPSAPTRSVAPTTATDRGTSTEVTSGAVGFIFSAPQHRADSAAFASQCQVGRLEHGYLSF